MRAYVRIEQGLHFKQATSEEVERRKHFEAPHAAAVASWWQADHTEDGRVMLALSQGREVRLAAALSAVAECMTYTPDTRDQKALTSLAAYLCKIAEFSA